MKHDAFIKSIAPDLALRFEHIGGKRRFQFENTKQDT